MTSDDELRALAERLDEATIDWNGTRMVDGEEPRAIPTCGEIRAASSAILSLMDERRKAVEALRQYACNCGDGYCAEVGSDSCGHTARTVLAALDPAGAEK